MSTQSGQDLSQACVVIKERPSCRRHLSVGRLRLHEPDVITHGIHANLGLVGQAASVALRLSRLLLPLHAAELKLCNLRSSCQSS